MHFLAVVLAAMAVILLALDALVDLQPRLGRRFLSGGLACGAAAFLCFLLDAAPVTLG